MEPKRTVRRALPPRYVVVLIAAAACEGGPDTPESVPAALEAAAGNEQSGVVGTTLRNPLVVIVRDAHQQPVRGATVVWQATVGGGTVAPSSSTTDAQGEATATFQLGTVAGRDTVTASIPSVASIAPVRFGATAMPGPPQSITVTPETLTLMVGERRALTAAARDTFRNAVAGGDVAWATNGGTVVTVSAGIVTALSPGVAVVTASIQGKTGSATITVVHGPPASLGIRGARSPLAAGETLQLTAEVHDSAGNLISDAVPVWTSSAGAVATVSTSGLVTALSAGRTTLTAVVGTRRDSVTMAVFESLGIYSETAPRLKPEVETFFGTFVGPGAFFGGFVEDSVTKKEGVASLRMTVQSIGNGFAGWFVAWGDSLRYVDDASVRDMSKFTGGSMRFWVQSPVDLEVGIRSGNVPAGIEASKTLLSQHGFTPGPGWALVCLPLTDLTGSNPLANLSLAKILFVVAVSRASGGTRGNVVTFWIDDVRWETRPC